MFASPLLENTRDIVHIIGIPAIIGVIVWLTKNWQAFDERTKNTEKLAEETKTMISQVTTNHLAHMAQDLGAQTVMLTNIDKNIEILVDRTPRI